MNGQTKKSSALPLWLCAAVLAFITATVFWPATHNAFLIYDDHDYVTGNPAIQRGVDWAAVKWAFTSGHAANWHPLTWLSHALDCQLFGMNPAAHHRTNILLHALNSVLLLLLLHQLTGRLGLSLFVAMVFAWHPLRVESVAWVAERKDLLSGLFFVLTLMAYASYARRRSSLPSSSRTFYCLSLVCFALGLMSKPMLVTLPAVLLLLDVWPLRRVPSSEFQVVARWKPLVLEKLPFLALAIASCVVTFEVQKAGGAVREFGLASRLANIPLAYLRYIEKFFWPHDLAVIYPFKPVNASTGLIAALVLAAICFAVIRGARRFPFLFTGWFWFVGMLVPVIGLVQVGYQAFADRYTYLPGIGLALVVAYGARQIAGLWRLSRATLAVVALVVILTLPQMTRNYLAHWSNTITLFEHSVRVTGPHTIALKNMGLAYMEAGRLAESQRCFEESLAIEPGDKPTLFNLGSVLLQQRKPDEALEWFEQVKSAKVLPHEASAYAKVAFMLAEFGKPRDAAIFYRKALDGDPRQLDALNNFAWLLATCPDDAVRDGAEAVRLAEQACQITGDRVPVLLGTLAAAYAEAGDFSKAIATAEKARDLAKANQQSEIVASNERLLEFYRAGKPVRESR